MTKWQEVWPNSSTTPARFASSSRQDTSAPLAEVNVGSKTFNLAYEGSHVGRRGSLCNSEQEITVPCAPSHTSHLPISRDKSCRRRVVLLPTVSGALLYPLCHLRDNTTLHCRKKRLPLVNPLPPSSWAPPACANPRAPPQTPPQILKAPQTPHNFISTSLFTNSPPSPVHNYPPSLLY